MSTTDQPRQLRITDTTLRDGSHAMAHQFTEEQVRATVHALDAAGVEVIEVTHGDGLGGSSFNYGFSRVDEIALIAAGVEEATQAKIAVLLVPGIGTKDDLRHAREAGATVARIATHCTEADVSIQHFGLARDLGMETVGFLMMAHKTSPAEMARQARIMVDAGAECVYCVDSAGALVLGDAQERIQAMYAEIGHQAEIGFHGHQNLSLGVANSVLAYQHGARQVDGALCALGAGAGNSPTEVLAATFDHLGVAHRRGRRRRAGRGRGGRPAVPAPLAEDGPVRDRAGLGRGVQQLPAARRTRRRALRRPGPRDPAAGRRARLRRRPGRHDHRHRGRARPGARPGRDRRPLRKARHGVRPARDRRPGDRVGLGGAVHLGRPVDREAWAEVALGGGDDADRAVQAARRAFDQGPWPKMGYAQRGALLHRFADLIDANAEMLALADSTDMGKPVSDARTRDVPRTAANYRFFADHARLATGDVLPMDTGHHAYTRFEPAGVVAAVAPWNFPL